MLLKKILNQKAIMKKKLFLLISILPAMYAAEQPKAHKQTHYGLIVEDLPNEDEADYPAPIFYVKAAELESEKKARLQTFHNMLLDPYFQAEALPEEEIRDALEREKRHIDLTTIPLNPNQAPEKVSYQEIPKEFLNTLLQKAVNNSGNNPKGL